MKRLELITRRKKDLDVIRINKDDIDKTFFDGIDDYELHDVTEDRIGMSINGEFADLAIALPEDYDYVLGTDNNGQIILVPLKKQISLN